jgi:hypothetical protein
MTSALASIDLCEQVAALFLGDALHENAIGATAVEITFYHRISLSIALCAQRIHGLQ